MRVEESLNLTSDETPPSPKTSPLKDDDLVEEEAIEVNKTRHLGNDVKDKSLKIDEIINIKESKSYPLENVIGNLNLRTLRSQAQDKNPGANERSPMLEKGNYIPWESRFRLCLDNMLEDGERMWNSIQKGPYKRPMIPDPDNDQKEIIEPLSKMTKGNMKQYIADERNKRLMFGSDVTSHVRQLRLLDEFDKFATKEGESLESMYERLTTLVNIMDRNNVRPIPMSINTKFLNCLQPEWSKYVTMLRHNQIGDTDGKVDIQTKNAGYGGNEFGDSYEAPTTDEATGSSSEGTATKKGRKVALTTKDMQKRKNDVKARTTLLLALLHEHQLRFSKYKTAQELWAAI
nr:Gag-Pol polyprotein [Tanacetum cinerariifolium]